MSFKSKIGYVAIALLFAALGSPVVVSAAVGSPPVPIMGTESNDTLVGTSGNDVIDGGAGADVMIGLAGDDCYYIDNEGDEVVENPDEGFDTVELEYGFWTNVNDWLHPSAYVIPTNVEKVVMGADDFDIVEFEPGNWAKVYGDPIDWRDLMDDNQFNNESNLVNTCTMASIANVMTMLGSPVKEEEVLAYMLANDLVGIPSRGDTPPENVAAALENGYGCQTRILTNRPMSELAGYLESGRAIILGVDYGVVNETASPRGYDDHAITLTGVAYNDVNGGLEGFYYADSGETNKPSGASFMSTNLFFEAHGQYVPDGDYSGSQLVVVDAPLKVQRDSYRVNGVVPVGKVIIGNSGDNVIWTTNGNDYVEGGEGNDEFHDEAGGNDVFLPGEGDDAAYSVFGADSFVFSAGTGNDEINDTDAEIDDLVFDLSIDKADVVFGLDGADLLVSCGSNGLVRVNGYMGDHGFRIRLADGTALDQAALSNLVSQMEAYCTANSIDFSDIEAVNAEPALVAMVQGPWQPDTNAIGYKAWTAMNGVGHKANGLAHAPAGDGIGNLLKYAAGLPPSQPVAASNLYTFASSSTAGTFTMFYSQSKRANASLEPEWSASVAGGWQTNGILKTLLGESATNELWEASLPLGQSGFMRLRAELNE